MTLGKRSLKKCNCLRASCGEMESSVQPSPVQASCLCLPARRRPVRMGQTFSTVRIGPEAPLPGQGERVELRGCLRGKRRDVQEVSSNLRFPRSSFTAKVSSAVFLAPPWSFEAWIQAPQGNSGIPGWEKRQNLRKGCTASLKKLDNINANNFKRCDGWASNQLREDHLLPPGVTGRVLTAKGGLNLVTPQILGVFGWMIWLWGWLRQGSFQKKVGWPSGSLCFGLSELSYLLSCK